MELVFSDGSQFELSYELLRVYSPSAECAGTDPARRSEVAQVPTWISRRSNRAAATQCSQRFSDGHTPASIPGTTCTGWAKNAMPCGGNTSSASQRPGEPRAGPSAFRAAAEIK